jgi:hypothetical protein
LLKQIQPGGCVAAVGLAAGDSWDASVVPFILRGVTLAGIDSVMQPFAARVAAGTASIVHEELESGGELVQAGAIVADPASGRPVGVVIASDHLTGEVATESRKIITAHNEYRRLDVLSRPLQGMYLSLFLMMTLMILVSATWMGLYLAKRVTRAGVAAVHAVVEHTAPSPGRRSTS